MPHLDTTPLTAPIRRRDVRAFWRSFRNVTGVRDPQRAARYLMVAVGTVAVPIGVLAMSVGIGQELEEHAPDMIGQLVGMSAIMVLFLAAGVILVWTAARMRARRRSHAEYLRLSRFATANDLDLTPGRRNGSHLTPWAERGVLVVSDAMRTRRSVAEAIVEFGDYELVTGSSGGRNTTFGGYAATRVGTWLPNIRVESRGVRRLRTTAVRRDQRLSLEGDFDRHFRLTCPSGYERDALYLFPPDVMAVLIDHAADFDIELVDDWVFLSTPRDVITMKPERWDAVATATGAVLSKVSQWQRWRDDRVPRNRLADPGTVAVSGRRLRFGPGAATMLGLLASTAFAALVIISNAVR